jgi:hypothetical protein
MSKFSKWARRKAQPAKASEAKPVAKHLVWISFDLDFKGDYEGMYEWLDAHNARDCGENLAALDRPYAGDPLPALKRSLGSKMTFGKRDRVYVIFKNQAGRFVGRFLIGKRRRAPWTGASFQESGDDDNEG